MKEYRAYLIGDDGHIVSAIPMTGENDEAAIITARVFLTDRAIEIWSGDRFVIRLEPER